MIIYYKKKFWAGGGALLRGLALPGTCLFVGWERFDLKDAVLTTFMVLSGISGILRSLDREKARQDRDEDREKCLSHLRALMAGQANWDGRLRDCAARDLLELANDWASDGGCEEREPEEITRGQFMERLEPDAVQISGDGSFDFWFNDGALFWGHRIHVTGSLEGGPEKAEMEG